MQLLWLENYNVDQNKKLKELISNYKTTFNTDTGAGLSFGIEDKNIFGSGNSISSNFLINSEDLKFDVNYIQYPILKFSFCFIGSAINPFTRISVDCI